jgi:hypothetical protein
MLTEQWRNGRFFGDGDSSRRDGPCQTRPRRCFCEEKMFLEGSLGYLKAWMACCCLVVVGCVPRELGWVFCECVKVWVEKRVEVGQYLDLYPLKRAELIYLNSTYCGL